MSRADPVPTGHKRCSRCRRVKPLTEFHRAKHNRSGDGYRSACKKCRWKLPQEIPDQSREAMEAASDTDLRPRQPPPESGPGLTYPMPEPVPEPMPASSPAMPRYLRDALKAESIPDRAQETVVVHPFARRSGDSGPGLTYPIPEPVSDPDLTTEGRRWWPKPIEVKNPPMPLRLRAVIEEERRSRYA